MYVVAAKSKLEGRYFGVMNTLPDGRVYIPINEMRNVGTLVGVDIIGGRDLGELIKAQQESMNQTENIDPEFGISPQVEEDIDPEFGKEPQPEQQITEDNEVMNKNKKGGKR